MQAWYCLGQYENCLQDAIHALELEPELPKGLYRAGLACMMLDKYQNAVVYLSKLVENQTRDSESVSTNSEDIMLHRAECLASLEEIISNYKKKKNGELHQEKSNIKDFLELITALEDDINGDGDTDVQETLKALSEVLTESNECRALFIAVDGYRLVWYFFKTESSCKEASLVIKSACGIASNVRHMPINFWNRLIAVALDTNDSGILVSGMAMDLIQWAAEADVWVRTQLLMQPMIANPNVIPLIDIMQAVSLPRAAGGKSDNSSQKKIQNSNLIGVDGYIAASKLLKTYSESKRDLISLRGLSCGPLLCCLTAFSNADKLVSKSEQAKTKMPLLNEQELEARESLLQKKKEIYNAEAIKVKHAFMDTAFSLMESSREILLDESIIRNTSESARSSQSKQSKAIITAGPLIPYLIGILQKLESESPKKTVAVLGPDGEPAAYTKRPFAADFKDNPAGDFLTNLNLEEGGNYEEQESVSTESGTLIEKCLKAFEIVLNSSQASILICYREGLLSICKSLGDFLTLHVVEKSQKICAQICDSHRPAAEEIVDSKIVIQLAAIIKYSKDNSLITKCIDKLAPIVDACSGNDFEALTGTHGILRKIFTKALHSECDSTECFSEKESARALLLRCAERAERYQGKQAFLRGGWVELDKKLLLKLIRPPKINTNSKGNDEDNYNTMKKGFFDSLKETRTDCQREKLEKIEGKQDLNGREVISPQNENKSPTNQKVMSYQNGVTIEEITDSYPSPSIARERTKEEGKSYLESKTHAMEGSMYRENIAVENSNVDSEAGIADLQDVFDSSPAASVRLNRAAWMNIPSKDKMRWDQTSSDISIWLPVPLGTKASEITVDVKPKSITVKLSWFGKILDGILYASVKSQESTWCLEQATAPSSKIQHSSIPEIHVILSKSGNDHWWKALLENGEEKGYYELLQDAVNAGTSLSLLNSIMRLIIPFLSKPLYLSDA